MGDVFRGIGKVITGVLGWIVGAAIVLTILALLVTFGTAILGIIAAIVILALVVGGIRKLFGIKSDPAIKVKFKRGEPYVQD